MYNNRSSRKIDSQRLFSREYDFPKSFFLTENRFSGKTYFYTTASQDGLRSLYNSISVLKILQVDDEAGSLMTDDEEATQKQANNSNHSKPSIPLQLVLVVYNSSMP